MSTKFRHVLLAATLVLGAISGGAQAALINSYDFDGDYTDTLGVGNDLTASGGVISGGRYNFGRNQGLRLTDALADTANYGIELGFSVSDSLSGYNKLIDFHDLASDLGLYILSGALRHYTATGAGGSMTLNTDFTVGLLRSAGTFSIYLDNVLVASGADGGNQGISPANILNFFEDDNATGQAEAFVGSADFIRIHDDATTFGEAPPAVPLPATGLLLFGALGGMAALRRRKKS